MNKKEYSKLIKEKLSGFLEAHHVDIHDRLDLIETTLVRIEIKLDRVVGKLDELELYELDENFDVLFEGGEEDIRYNRDVLDSKPETYDILGEK